MEITKNFVGRASGRSSTAVLPRIRGTERGRPAPAACLSHADPAHGLRTGMPNVRC